MIASNSGPLRATNSANFSIIFRILVSKRNEKYKKYKYLLKLNSRADKSSKNSISLNIFTMIVIYSSSSSLHMLLTIPIGGGGPSMMNVQFLSFITLRKFLFF